MSTMGERIKDLRIKNGLSQEELAIELGYSSRSSINKIEIGRSDLPQSKIPTAARILKTDPAYLIGWEEVPISISDGNDSNITYLKEHGEDKLIELYNKVKEDGSLLMLMDKATKLTPEEVAQILRIIDAL